MENSTSSPQFFVYVIESPSAPDLYHGRSESDLLARALRLCGVVSVSRCAISRVAFRAALQTGLKEEMAEFHSWMPIVHISSHGDVSGIQLSSGEVITWQELGELIGPINAALNGRLILSMSCCEGYAAIRMAFKEDDSPLPYFALLGALNGQLGLRQRLDSPSFITG